MKCWIDGSSCPYQTGDNSFGLLNVSSNFCRDCNVLKFDLENIEKTLEKMGLLEFFPGLKHGIDEDDQYEISEHAGIILASLGLLKKEID